MTNPASSTSQDHLGPLVAGRECGECQECCIAPAINKPEVQKFPGSPCVHSLQGGCNIYGTRPDPCRTFFCGWRRSRDFPDDWRPDRSGFMAILEVNDQPQFQPLAAALNLVGNPLKTIRRPDFIDFVAKSLRNNVAIYLMLSPGPGMQSARMLLNVPLLVQAAGKSRAEMKAVLEEVLKILVAHPAQPYVMDYSGHDMST
jgi:hypothetical protein